MVQQITSDLLYYPGKEVFQRVDIEQVTTYLVFHKKDPNDIPTNELIKFIFKMFLLTNSGY